MKLPAAAAILFVSILAAFPAAYANETAIPYAPQLSEVIRTAMEKAPELPAAKARLSSARSLVTSSTALPDPYMEMTGQAMGISPIGPSSSLVLEYRQEFPYPGKRAARKASAEAITLTYEKDIDDIKASIREDVSIRYANIYALDRELKAIDDAERLISSAKKAAAGRYSSGLSEKSALIKLDLEASRLRQRRAGVMAARLAEAAQINRYIGAPPDAPFGEVASLPLGTFTDMKNIEAGIESSPGIVRIRARAEVAQSRMKELKLEERPDFMLGGGGGIDGDVNPVVMLRMGVKLPLFKDTKQGIATESAMYEYYAAKAELEDARSQLRTQMAVLAAELKKTGAVIDEYSGSIIPNSRAVFDATLAEYVAGRSDFSTLIEDLNSLINAKAELAKAESERLSVSARLQRLTGSIDRENTGDGRQETVEKHETKTN